MKNYQVQMISSLKKTFLKYQNKVILKKIKIEIYNFHIKSDRCFCLTIRQRVTSFLFNLIEVLIKNSQFIKISNIYIINSFSVTYLKLKLSIRE